MKFEKPIIVHHPGFWRTYRFSRELLRSASLGDLIPSHQAEWCDEPAAKHLFSRPDAPLDVIAVEPPREEEWARLGEIAANADAEGIYADPLIWAGASTILRAPNEPSIGRD